MQELSQSAVQQGFKGMWTDQIRGITGGRWRRLVPPTPPQGRPNGEEVMINTPLSSAAKAVVLRYIQRRRIPTNDINAYVDPPLDLFQHRLPDAGKAEDRLRAAIKAKENVVIFGD